MIEIALAFAAGVLTAAAPCILPLLPVLLGASIGQHDRGRPLFLVAGFILTFSGFAILFGSFSTVLGLSHDTLRRSPSSCSAASAFCCCGRSHTSG